MTLLAAMSLGIGIERVVMAERELVWFDGDATVDAENSLL
jgi:hypothetical protein